MDNATLGSDSDILSMTRKVADWITCVDSTAAHEQAVKVRNDYPIHGFDDRDAPPVKLPNTELGIVRYGAFARFRCHGLRITQGNIDELLTFRDEPTSSSSEPLSSTWAVGVTEHMTRQHEILTVPGADLDYLESAWAGGERLAHEPFDGGQGTTFYAAFQYRCFINDS